MVARTATIASYTFRETIRQPIFGVCLVVTTLLHMLNVALAGFTLDDDDKLLLDLGLSTLLLGGLFLAVFSASGILSQEIDRKTVVTLVSKPISRPLLIVGKCIGLFAAVSLAFYMMFLVFALACRHRVLQYSADPYDMPVLVFGFGGVLLALGVAAFCNYFYDKEFASVAIPLAALLLTAANLAVGFFDKEFALQPWGEGLIDIMIVLAAGLVLMAVLVLAAVALAASTRLGQVSTLLVCIVVLIIGLISDYTFGQYSDKSALAEAIYRVIPNFSIFWTVDAITAQVGIPIEYVLRTSAYAGLWIIALVALAVALFQKREVG